MGPLPWGKSFGCSASQHPSEWSTLEVAGYRTNIPRLWKRKIIFKSYLGRDSFQWVPFIFCLHIFLKLCFLLYVLWLFIFVLSVFLFGPLLARNLFFLKILFSRTKRMFSFTTYLYIYICLYTHVIINKDLSMHYVFTTVNELNLRTSPTASVKVLDLLEQLLPPKLTRMSRGRCWLWRVVKHVILWSKHWLVGLFVGDDFWDYFTSNCKDPIFNHAGFHGSSPRWVLITAQTDLTIIDLPWDLIWSLDCHMALDHVRESVIHIVYCMVPGY